MKAKLIRDMEVSPGITPKEWIKTVNGKEIIPAGTVFEQPQAYYQVLQGNAEAVDEECKARVSRVRTPMQLLEARLASDDLNASMVPDEDDDEDLEEDDE